MKALIPVKLTIAVLALPFLIIYAWILLSFSIMTTLPPVVLLDKDVKRSEAILNFKKDVATSYGHAKRPVRGLLSWCFR